MFYDIVTHPLAHPIISVLGIIIIGGAAWFWWRKVE
jgi:LPXTG-motif cell wall-anchored protein